MARLSGSVNSRNYGPTHLFLTDLNERHHGWVSLRSEEPPSNIRVFKEINGVEKLIRLEAPDGSVIERYD